MPTVTAKYVTHGEKFEILVDSELAWEYKLGKRNTLDNVLVSDIVYKDVNRGEKATASSLTKVFGTTDIRKIADEILKKGELPITAERRNKLIEENKRRIIDFIARNCIDTRTNAPVPPQRVELAMNEAKVRIDPFKDPELQATEIIKQIKKIIPIREAKAILKIELPSDCAGKAYTQIIGKSATVTSSNWRNDRSWEGEIEIPAGTQEVFIRKLNEICKGKANIKEVKIV